LAGEKYAAALTIKDDKHDTLNNWGIALSDQAKTKTGDEADRLFALAGEKYAAALAIKPDKHESLNGWGNALSDQAKTKAGDEADRLLALAGEIRCRARHQARQT
jgi:Tfp pilus assembly protein PilF